MPKSRSETRTNDREVTRICAVRVGSDFGQVMWVRYAIANSGYLNCLGNGKFVAKKAFEKLKCSFKPPWVHIPAPRDHQAKHLRFFVFCMNDRDSLAFNLDGAVHGSVMDMPNILPGGNASMAFPVSFETNRIAIASSTACCRFSATCKLDA